MAESITSACHSPAKKPKLSIFQQFSESSESIDILKRNLSKLCSTDRWSFVSLTVKHCNAAYASYGRSFSQADVDVKENVARGDILFHVRAIFASGFSLLDSYLNSPESPPSDGRLRIILSSLLEYLLDKEQHKILQSAHKQKNKSELVVRFAQHFFSRLGISLSYTLNKYYRKTNHIEKCTCSCGADISKHYGDTSIGNENVWHGNMDIILDESFLPVSVVDDDEPDFLENNFLTDIKRSGSLEDPAVISQMLAQSVVFSFTAKKKHPDLNNFLIPFIGVNRTDIVFYLYDSEHDILLKSPTIPFLVNGDVNTLCVLAAWFVVNYKFLCSGVPANKLDDVKKANFFEMAESYLPIYQNELSVDGGVSSGYLLENHYDPSLLTMCQLVCEADSGNTL